MAARRRRREQQRQRHHCQLLLSRKESCSFPSLNFLFSGPFRKAAASIASTAYGLCRDFQQHKTQWPLDGFKFTHSAVSSQEPGKVPFQRNEFLPGKHCQMSK